MPTYMKALVLGSLTHPSWTKLLKEPLDFRGRGLSPPVFFVTQADIVTSLKLSLFCKPLSLSTKKTTSLSKATHYIVEENALLPLSPTIKINFYLEGLVPSFGGWLKSPDHFQRSDGFYQ